MLSYHIARVRRQLQAASRHRWLSRLPLSSSSRRSVFLLLCLSLLGLLLFLFHFPVPFVTLHDLHLQVTKTYTPRSSQPQSYTPRSSKLRPAQPALATRPSTLRQHYLDALTTIADHSSLFSPATHPELDWSKVADSEAHRWRDHGGSMRAVVTELIAAASASSSPSAPHRRALLSSLLQYQLHPHDSSCSSSSKYLLYAFHNEYAAVNSACLSNRHLVQSLKPPHRAANKVSSVREIMDALAKEAAARRRPEVKDFGQPHPLTVEELTDECRLSALVDVVRALFVAQASGRELVLLPVAPALCERQMTEVAGAAAGQWLGCVWSELFLRPSACGWDEVRAVVEAEGYHEDAFSPSSVALYRPLEHCHSDDSVFQQLQDTIAPFMPAASSSSLPPPLIGRLPLFQLLTRFLLSPNPVLQQHINSTQSELFSAIKQHHAPSASAFSSLLTYYFRYRASKDAITLPTASTPLLQDISRTLLQQTAATGVKDVLIWLEGDVAPSFLSLLQDRLPHLRLFQLAAATASPTAGLLSSYMGSVSKLFLFSGSGGGMLLTHASPVGRLLHQLTDDDDSSAALVVDLEGDEWFYDCPSFSWHFYRAHTADTAVQRVETGVNGVLYPLLSPPPVQLLVVVGVSEAEVLPFAAMFDRLDCGIDGAHGLRAHRNLSLLLQRLFMSPQTVDVYAGTRSEFQQQLQLEVARLQSIPLSASSSSSSLQHIIRVDFLPWDINRPFRGVLKADVAMVSRFFESLASFLPVRLRLLLLTREPPAVLYAGTKLPSASIPTDLPLDWRFFFVARVLHDHMAALIGEVRAMLPSVYHVVDMDDLGIHTARQAQQLAAFIDRPACARPVFQHFRSYPPPNVTAARLPDLTLTEAAGVLDISSSMRHHGLFERAESWPLTLDALSDHKRFQHATQTETGRKALTPDVWPEGKTVRSRAKEGELLLHVIEQQQALAEPQTAAAAAASASASAASPTSSSASEVVISAVDELQPQVASSCANRRFLVFDLLLRAHACHCDGEKQSSDSRPAELDDPPVAETLRALGRTLSLALATGRTVLIPSVESAAPASAASASLAANPLAALSYLSSALTPLSACTLQDAGLRLGCHCPTKTWRMLSASSASSSSPVTASALLPLESAFESGPAAVIGHAQHFHFGWLLRHNLRHEAGSISPYAFISTLHSHIFTTIARNEQVMAHLASYRDSLSSAASFSQSSPTLAFSLPRSDYYVVSTYVGILSRLMDLHGLSQLYLSASCSLLYQHQREDTATGSRPPSCAEQRSFVRQIEQHLDRKHRRHKTFHPLSTRQLRIVTSPRVALSNASSVEQHVLAALADVWLMSQSQYLVLTQASEEGLLLSELAFLQQRAARRVEGSEVVSPPLYDLFGHSWLEGMQASTLQQIAGFVRSAMPRRPLPRLASATAAHVVLPGPIPLPLYPPSIVKTVFSSSVRFVFIAGIEGAGHHFVESVLGGSMTYSPWSPASKANISRAKTVDEGAVVWEDLLPNDPDVLGDGGKIDGEERTATASPGLLSHPNYELNLPLTRLVYELFVHDSVTAYMDSRARLVAFVRALVAEHEEPPRLPAGVPFHPKQAPVLFPVNHLGAAFGMHSYPNMFGADKSMHHPYLAALAAVMEEAGADFRVLLTVRSPEACHWSTVRRHHGEEIGAHAAYMFQARGLHDNLAFLDNDIRALDTRFVLQLHLTDVTRNPFRYAAAIAEHVGIQQRSLQTSLLQLSHSFAVQPDGAWRAAINSSQQIAVRDIFESSPLLGLFKHRYDSLKHDNWQGKDHLCRAPQTLKRFSRSVRWTARRAGGEGEDGEQEAGAAGGGGDVQEERESDHGATLVSLEGSGDSMVRWVVEQLTGFMTGSLHGDATPGSKSDAVPSVLPASMGRWTESGALLLVSERRCAFHCPEGEEDEAGSSFQADHPAIAMYQPVQWATRMAPRNQLERDADAAAEEARKERERQAKIILMEGPDAAGKYPPPARKPKALQPVSTPSGTGGSDEPYPVLEGLSGVPGVTVQYTGQDSNDLIVLYRSPGGHGGQPRLAAAVQPTSCTRRRRASRSTPSGAAGGRTPSPSRRRLYCPRSCSPWPGSTPASCAPSPTCTPTRSAASCTCATRT